MCAIVHGPIDVSIKVWKRKASKFEKFEGLKYLVRWDAVGLRWLENFLVDVDSLDDNVEGEGGEEVLGRGRGRVRGRGRGRASRGLQDFSSDSHNSGLFC